MFPSCIMIWVMSFYWMKHVLKWVVTQTHEWLKVGTWVACWSIMFARNCGFFQLIAFTCQMFPFLWFFFNVFPASGFLFPPKKNFSIHVKKSWMTHTYCLQKCAPPKYSIDRFWVNRWIKRIFSFRCRQWTVRIMSAISYLSSFDKALKMWDITTWKIIFHILKMTL